MPLALLLQLVHAALVADGATTQWLVAFPRERNIIRARIERLRKLGTDN